MAWAMDNQQGNYKKALGAVRPDRLPWGPMTQISVLDLSPIVQGGNAGQSFRSSLALARHAEALGYRRYWLAEHHGMPGIASAATAVLLAHVAAGTNSIRVGAGASCCPTIRRW